MLGRKCPWAVVLACLLILQIVSLGIAVKPTFAQTPQTNLVANGDFSNGLTNWNVVKVNQVPTCITGGQFPNIGVRTDFNNNPSLFIDVPCNTDGYVEQTVTIPTSSGVILTFDTWGHHDPVTAKVSIIDSQGLEHIIAQFDPACKIDFGCTSPETKTYDITQFNGQMVKVRFRNASSFGTGTFADFDNIRILTDVDPTTLNTQSSSGSSWSLTNSNIDTTISGSSFPSNFAGNINSFSYLSSSPLVATLPAGMSAISILDVRVKTTLDLATATDSAIGIGVNIALAKLSPIGTAAGLLVCPSVKALIFNQATKVWDPATAVAVTIIGNKVCSILITLGVKAILTYLGCPICTPIAIVVPGTGSGGGHIGSDPCTGLVYINTEALKKAPSNIDYSRCAIIDDVKPVIQRAYMTPNDILCLQVWDDVGIKRVTYGNGNEIPKWPGSIDQFCTDKQLPAVLQVAAEDFAGNISTMVTVNAQQLKTTHAVQMFTAVISKEAIPYNGVERIDLVTKEPIEQVRIGMSPNFNERVLWVSDTAFKEIKGHTSITAKYLGADKLMSGQLYVFAANRGLLATINLQITGDDLVYSTYEDKTHAPYDISLKEAITLDKLHLNAMQKAEFAAFMEDPDSVTTTRANVVSMILDGYALKH